MNDMKENCSCQGCAPGCNCGCQAAPAADSQAAAETCGCGEACNCNPCRCTDQGR